MPTFTVLRPARMTLTSAAPAGEVYLTSHHACWCPFRAWRSVTEPSAVSGRAGTMAGMENLREPYVGSGIDGALRSARIDESEADGLDQADPRRDELLESASRWRDQAAWLTAYSTELPPPVTFDEPNTLTEAAQRYDSDPDFRDRVDGTHVQGLTDADIDWDAFEQASRTFGENPPA